MILLGLTPCCPASVAWWPMQNWPKWKKVTGDSETTGPRIIFLSKSSHSNPLEEILALSLDVLKKPVRYHSWAQMVKHTPPSLPFLLTSAVSNYILSVAQAKTSEVILGFTPSTWAYLVTSPLRCKLWADTGLLPPWTNAITSHLDCIFASLVIALLQPVQSNLPKLSYEMTGVGDTPWKFRFPG